MRQRTSARCLQPYSARVFAALPTSMATATIVAMGGEDRPIRRKPMEATRVEIETLAPTRAQELRNLADGSLVIQTIAIAPPSGTESSETQSVTEFGVLQDKEVAFYPTVEQAQARQQEWLRR